MALSKGSKRFLVVLVVLGAVVGSGVMYGLDWIEENFGGDFGDVEPGQPVEVEIAEGSSAAEIGEQLEEEGIVRNANAFRFEVRNRGVDQGISPGTYEFETGMSVDAAVDVLEAGPLAPETYRVTIPEGWTVAQTLERLGEATPHSADDYRALLDARVADPANSELTVPEWVPDLASFGEGIEPFEGLLFPETYEFAEEATAVDVLQRLLDQTATVFENMPDDVKSQAEADGLSNYEALIIASLVEREARVSDEVAPIAGVIRNRLEEGMRLQIDATVQYARGEHAERLFVEDTEVDSPYNTYQIDGLPPTPIAGARAAAIRAAMAPPDVPYLFYVVAPECDGSHRFAETLDEHNQNVAAYREANRCQE